jgi:hypothetical protein
MPFRNPPARGIAPEPHLFRRVAHAVLPDPVAASGAGIEGRRRHLVIMVACGIAAAVLCSLATYSARFAIVGIAHLVRDFLDLDGTHLALLHFASALVCLVIARGQAKHRCFAIPRPF